MTNTLRFEVTQKEIDTNNDIYDEKSYTIDDTFTQYEKNRITLASGVTYTAINFNGITTAKVIRINSDQALNVKVNGGSEVFVVSSDLIWTGSFTALSLNNASGLSASIVYEIYA